MSNDSQKDNLDTNNIILQTLNVPHLFDKAAANVALNYLFSTQNGDGGWGERQGAESNIFATAMIIMMLQQVPPATRLTESIAKAASYLVTKQNQDGGFGSDVSTLHDTALAYIVLARGLFIDIKVLNNASDYLLSLRSENGSWNDDPYLTALTLRALYCAESDLTQISLPEYENAIGPPLESLINIPLKDTSTDIRTTPGGDKEGMVGQLHADNAVAISELHDIGPTGDQCDTISTDEVREDVAAIKVETVQKEEKRDDKRKVSLLARRKASAFAAQESGASAIHEAAVFDSQQSSETPLTTTGSIIGKVFDDVTKRPIEDVSITLTGGFFTRTDSQGVFAINDVVPDMYNITVYKDGYTIQSHEETVTADAITEMRALYLAPLCLENESEALSDMLIDTPAIHDALELQFILVSGVITDASTGKPIANVMTRVLETEHTFQTLSDGFYTLSDINLRGFNIEITASGYNTKVLEIKESTWGALTIDVALELSRANMWIKLDQTLSPSVITPGEDKQVKVGIRLEGMEAASNPVVLYAITNTSGDRITISFDKSMLDPSDKHTQFTVIVDDIANPVIAAVLNTPDITKIDLMLESSVASGQVISLGYACGDVASTEGRQLTSFSNQMVVNKVSPPIYNQGGFGFSGLISPNPLGSSIIMTGYNQWPAGFYKSVLAFAGSVFDGQCMWMVPANADSVIKIDKDTGVMTGYNKWPSEFRKGNLAFAGGVFDGEYVWMIPLNADRVIKIDKDTGEMTAYKEWPSGFIKGGHAFAGAVFDGQYIWMVPSYADRVIKIDKDTGEMTAYKEWPSGFIKGGYAFASTVFDGRNIWMLPANADRVIKIDKDTGEMTAYKEWPSGFIKGEYAFSGGVFDGQHIWMVPYYADRVIKIDKDTGEMTGVNQRPPEFNKVEYAFAGAVFDGQNIWMIPLNADKVIKIDKDTDTVAAYNQWPTGFSKGINAFAGAVFDGQNIWMIPSYADKVIRLSSFSTVSVSANLTANDTFYVYLSQDEDIEGILIGQGSRYSSTYSLNTALIPGVTNYLHIKCTDSMGPIAGFIGDFTLNNSNFSFTNGTQRLLTGEDCWIAYTDRFGGKKEKVTTICKNGMGKWATRFGIDLSSQWIWTGGGEDLEPRYFSTPIYYSSVPIVPIADVRVINTIMQAGVVVDEHSFSKEPYSVEQEKERTIVEWRYDRISINQREDVSFDVTLKNPLSGEDRLVSQNLELLYRDVINKQPVHTELGPRFIHIFNAAFTCILRTDKETYEVYEDIVISGIIKNLSEYGRTVDVRVVIGDSHGIPVEEVAVMPDLTFEAGEERDIGNIVCNIGARYSGTCMAHLLLDENQKQIGEISTVFTINIPPAEGQATEESVPKDERVISPPPESTGNTWDALSSINKGVIEEEVITNVAVNAGLFPEAIPEEGISGAINAQINPVYQGLAETISYNVVNHNNEDLKEFAAKVVIVNAGTQEIKQTFEAPKKHRKGKEFSGVFTFSTAMLEPCVYTAILYVTSASIIEPKPVESTTFEVRLINAIVT